MMEQHKTMSKQILTIAGKEKLNRDELKNIKGGSGEYASFRTLAGG